MIKRIFSVIRFFIKKHWAYFVAVFLLLLIFWSGFFCAWQIQANKAEVKHRQYTKVARDIIILLNYWEEKIRELQKEKEKRDMERKKQGEYNDLIED